MESVAEIILRIMCAIITLISIIFFALKFFLYSSLKELKEEFIKLMAHISLKHKQDIEHLKNRVDNLEGVVCSSKHSSEKHTTK